MQTQCSVPVSPLRQPPSQLTAQVSPQLLCICAAHVFQQVPVVRGRVCEGEHVGRQGAATGAWEAFPPVLLAAGPASAGGDAGEGMVEKRWCKVHVGGIEGVAGGRSKLSKGRKGCATL